MAQWTEPVLEFPGRGRAIIEPSRLLAGKKRIPPLVVLSFFGEVLDAWRQEGKLRQIQSLAGEGGHIPVYALGSGKTAVTVSWPGLTAPYSAAVLEELIGLGGRSFIVCGGAGVLDSSIAPGTLIVPDRALRGEGTSFHYLRASRTVRPHPRALEAIRAACRARRVDFLSGMTWTTDGVYRETPAAVRRRRREGCLTVEMEAAALFAVARFRKVVLGQILYAGDDVSGPDWNPRGWNQRSETRRELFELAVGACRTLAV